MSEAVTKDQTKPEALLRKEQSELLPAERAFVARLRELSTGERAILKRNAGNTLAESRGCRWFFRLLDESARGWDSEIYFLVATLFGLDKYEAAGNFGKSMERLCRAANKEAIERRFLVLLDSEFDREGGAPAGGELAFRLRQMVKLAASKEIGVDWAQLLADLKRWGLPSRRVQKAWAASFYPAPVLNSSASTETGDVVQP